MRSKRKVRTFWREIVQEIQLGCRFGGRDAVQWTHLWLSTDRQRATSIMSHAVRSSWQRFSSSSPAFGQTPQPFPRPGEQPRPQPAAPPVTPDPRRRRRRLSRARQAPSTGRATAGRADARIRTRRPPPSSGFPSIRPRSFSRRTTPAAVSATTSTARRLPSPTSSPYYRTQLDERGDLVFKEPPTHMFEVGRFREETMAFPPGVTVKDWTWGGSQGYPNPKLGAQPARFPTIIMIVPPPPAAPRRRQPADRGCTAER